MKKFALSLFFCLGIVFYSQEAYCQGGLVRSGVRAIKNIPKVPPIICDDSFGESRRGKLRYSFKHDDWIYEIEHDKSIRIYVPKESVMEYKKAWKQYGYHKHIYGY